jgi:hypothetical protein
MTEPTDRLTDAERAEAVEAAIDWIEGCEHQPGCSGEWGPHRCKCNKNVVLDSLSALLTAEVPGIPAAHASPPMGRGITDERCHP